MAHLPVRSPELQSERDGEREQEQQGEQGGGLETGLGADGGGPWRADAGDRGGMRE